MRTKELIQLIIGATGIVIEDITLHHETREVVMAVRPTKREQCRCGICRRRAKRYDSGRGRRRWRCQDMGSWRVYVEAEEPRVCCKEHGVVTAAVPWAWHRSRFTKAFEDTAAWLTVHASHSVVAEYLRVEWHSVGRICQRVYRELEASSPNRFEGLVNIGIDETSYKKGHKYMTVVIDHDTASVVWCSAGFRFSVHKVKIPLDKTYHRLWTVTSRHMRMRQENGGGNTLKYRVLCSTINAGVRIRDRISSIRGWKCPDTYAFINTKGSF